MPLITKQKKNRRQLETYKVFADVFCHGVYVSFDGYYINTHYNK